MGALIVFLAFPLAAFAAVTRPFGSWAAFSIVTGVLSLVAVGAFFAAFEGTAEGGTSSAGFFERLPTLFIGAWQVAFTLRVLGGNRAMGAVPARA